MDPLSLTAVTKQYPDKITALKDVDLVVHAGEFLSLVGPSGSGKTTLLRLVAGLEPVTSGSIEMQGQDVGGQASHQRGVTMAFQSSPLYPHMTVAQNMGFALKMSGAPKGEVRERVGEIAASLQVESLLSRRPATLSAGQRQLVGIGKALVREAPVTLFDEPLSHVDAPLRRELRDRILAWHAARRTTCLWVTHDQSEAMHMADRVCVLDQGQIQQVGAPEEVLRSPANSFVAEFFMIDLKETHRTG